MAYTFFAVSAYIFMRAFEVVFADQKEEKWYKITTKVIGSILLFIAFSAMIVFYFKDLHLLGFNPK